MNNTQMLKQLMQGSFIRWSKHLKDEGDINLKDPDQYKDWVTFELCNKIPRVLGILIEKIEKLEKKLAELEGKKNDQ